jgi:hypothetical protein
MYSRVLEQIFDTIDSQIKEYPELTIISQRLCQHPEDLKALACDAMVLGTLLKVVSRPAFGQFLVILTVRQVISNVAEVEYAPYEINKDGMHGRYGRNRGKEVHDQVNASCH